MELIGHSPFIVFDDADIKKATDMAIAAKFRNNGQVCISPNRFYIQENNSISINIEENFYKEGLPQIFKFIKLI